MPRSLFSVVLAIGCLLGISAAQAQEKKEVKPIRALLITGGCCHDYAKQKVLLPEVISKRANVEWVVVHQGGSSTKSMIPYYEKEDWAKGFDIVVHNECFADAADPAWTAKILKPHREGTPAVVVHCAMHCYRDKTDEWFKFLGVTSRGHGANYPFEIVNLEAKDPIMKEFGEKWKTPKGELYIIEKMWPSAKPLAHAMSRDTKKNEVCIWTNMYNDKTRVFGTTIGHHNEEITDEVFGNYMARGLLWACDKLNDDYLKPAKEIKIEHIGDPKDDKPKGPMGEPTPAKKTGMKVLAPKNLAIGKKATASASQTENGHKPENAIDGDESTRWCPNNAQIGHWWQVDLGQPEEVKGCRVVWEFDDRRYQYKVEGSEDGKTWKMLADETAAKAGPQEREHKFDAPNTRYVKITTTGLQTGAWGSFFEFEALGKELVERTVSSAAPQRVPTGGKNLLAGIKAPPGFKVSLFATPPNAGYPTCLATAPSGEVFIGIDENGSLDAKANRGRVVRAADRDGDGMAEEFKTFATMDSPRGLVFDNNTLYVMHPPLLTAFHDDNGDGVSDRSEVLVKGLGFDLKFRGADHTTNGMQIGIDGNLYVAVGDYGFVEATDKDGKSLQMLGGGIVRVGTDGKNLEIVSRGQRNIYDVAIDPLMNLFTRDNTNDGGGWNVRLSHVIPSGQYGYPSLFVNFPDEIVQPLADYGGGSPCGSLFVDEAALPAPFNHALYTCDWGRSIVYRHPLTARGAGFEAKQEAFIEIPRPTDMEVDASGRLYIASWRDGNFNYSGPNVGYVVCVTHDDLKAAAPVDVTKLKPQELIAQIGGNSHVARWHAQRELVRRSVKGYPEVMGLIGIANGDGPLASRVAAIYTIQQLMGKEGPAYLKPLAAKDDLREFVLQAMANYPATANHAPGDLYIAALSDKNPRVRRAAAWGLGRLPPAVASTAEEKAKFVALVADADPLVSHTAINSLVARKEWEACLAVLTKTGSDEQVDGVRRVLQAIHDPKVVAGLTNVATSTSDKSRRRAALAALCRLSLVESPYVAGKWWGTRPDTSGPYFAGKKWEESSAIVETLRGALAKSDADDAKWLLTQFKRNKVDVGDQNTLILTLAQNDKSFADAAIELLTAGDKPSAEARKFIAKTAISSDGATQVKAFQALYRTANDDIALGMAIDSTANVLFAMKAAQPGIDDAFAEFARDPRHAPRVDTILKQTQGQHPQAVLAYQCLLAIENNAKAPPAARKKALAAIDEAWKKPENTAALLVAIGFAQADAYALQVAKLRDSKDDAIRSAAQSSASRLGLDSLPNENDPKRVTIVSQKPEVVLAAVEKASGDAKLGARLFVRQGCVACHSTKQGETLKGPYLGGIAARYKRPELAESVLTPSKKIAQGFETQWFQTADGLTVEGFVVRESGTEVEIRNQQGAASLIAKSDIEERGKRETSMMPNGLIDKLTAEEFAAILTYLESLKQ